MNREWLCRAAVRLYPSAVRTERGAELVGTLLDAGDASTAIFVVQLGSVIAAALAARLREAMTRATGQLVIDILAWAAVITAARYLVADVAAEIRWPGNVQLTGGTLPALGLPALVLVLFALRRTRTSGLVGLGWIAFSIMIMVEHNRISGHVFFFFTTFVFWYGLPVAGFAALALAPRRVASGRRWVWLAPTAVLALFDLTWIGGPSGLVGGLAFVIVALAFLPFTPAFALGTALAQSAWGLWFLAFHSLAPWTDYSIEVLTFTALAVTAAVVGRLRVRRNLAETTPTG